MVSVKLLFQRQPEFKIMSQLRRNLKKNSRVVSPGLSGIYMTYHNKTD